MEKSIFDDVNADEVKQLKDGSYTGQIVSITRNTENFDYTRYKVAVDGEDMSLDVSYPTRTTFLEDGKGSSEHAKMLLRMGYKYEKGKPIGSFIESLHNKKVKFAVVNVERELKDKTTAEFSEIVKHSVKPL